MLLALFAKAGEVAKFPLFGDSLRVGDCGSFEVGPQKSDLLWTQRLQSQQVQNRRWIFLEELLAQRVVAGLHDLFEMLDHAVADSRKFLELLRLLDELLDGFGQAVDQFGRLFIAAIPPDDGAVAF